MSLLELIDDIRKRVAREHLPAVQRKTGVSYDTLRNFSVKGGNFRDPADLEAMAKWHGYQIVAVPLENKVSSAA